jgi:hypothetical protein
MSDGTRQREEVAWTGWILITPVRASCAGFLWVAEGFLKIY